MHRDQYSIVNGIFQFGCPLYGGTTLFFESDKITQMCGIEHVHGRYILSAFDRIYHGASEVSGVALLVVVVVVVVLPFDFTDTRLRCCFISLFSRPYNTGTVAR